MDSDAISLPWEDLDPPVSGKVVKLQDYPCRRIHSDCSKVAQHAWSCDHVKLRSACMALRASAVKEQGFSEAVAARIETPQEDQPDQSLLTTR